MTELDEILMHPDQEVINVEELKEDNENWIEHPEPGDLYKIETFFPVTFQILL